MNKKEIILIDFSKVISPIGISNFLSKNLEKHLTISQKEIKKIYKEEIGNLVIGKYSIFSFLKKLEKKLKNDSSIKDLKKEVYKIPTINKKFLDLLLIIKKKYKIILISDIYKELGLKLKKKLKTYFDNFIFSFEEKNKKSQNIFWENLSKKIIFKNIKLFIDDKEENIKLAYKFGINGIIYKNFKEIKYYITKTLFTYKNNIILGAGASGILYGYFLKKKNKKDFLILEKEKDSL